MGTRCGQLDAAVVLYLLQAHGMTAEQITTLLYRESGLLGLSGVSADMCVLEASVVPAAAGAIRPNIRRTCITRWFSDNN